MIDIYGWIWVDGLKPKNGQFTILGWFPFYSEKTEILGQKNYDLNKISSLFQDEIEAEA